MVRAQRSVLWRVPLVAAALLVGFGFQAHAPAGSRRLKEEACEGGGFTDPLDLQSPWAGLVYLLGILYTFQGIAMVCEDYFVAALNRLIEEWKISPDVAGATFMAAGTSSPELFAALVGLFVSSSSDTGVGTVVGSAVFNILIIIGGSLLVIPAGFIQIEIPPLLRDTAFYLIALLALLLSFNDGKVTLLESSIMVLCYVAYVFANAFFGSLLTWYERVFGTDEATALVDDKNHLGSNLGLTRGNSGLNPSVYSEAPVGEAAKHTFATRLDLMSHTRQSIVSSFYGLQEGEEVLEMEIDNTKPLERTYAGLHPKQRQHIEALFSRAAVAALDAAGASALDGDDDEEKARTDDELADQEDGAAAAKDGALISPHLSVPEHILVEALSREALAAPRIGHNTMLDEYGDLFKILRLANTSGVGSSISWSEFLPAYATWHQCGMMFHLRPLYSDADIDELKARFADSDTDHDGKLSSTEMQRAVANAIPTLNGPQRWSLAELFDYSNADVAQLGFLMTCALYLGYHRALEAARPHKEFKLPEPDVLDDGAPAAAAGKKQKRFSLIQTFEPDQSIHVPHNIFDMPKDPLDIAMYLMGFPFALAFRLTIVDCRQPKLTKFYGLTLFLAIVWLAILVTFMISWAEKMGCLWGLTPSLLGMTLCAGGTSLPDCLASMIVARQGEGMMAVSNALGSNIFDILFGLGFPFFLKTLVINEGAEETVSSQGIVGSVVVLLVLQVAFTLVVVVQRLRVGRAVGYLFVSCYGVFLVYCYLSLQVTS